MAHEKDTLIALVLDKSGSMGHLRQSTIEGLNAFLDEQRETQDAGEAFVSLTLFDTSFDVRYVGTPIAQVAPLGSPTNQYSTGGGTALYDGVGVTVAGVEQWIRNNEFGGKVVVVIFTDGEENSSRQFHIWDSPNAEDDKDLNNLIQAKQDEGWDFVFLGTGQSAWTEAKKFTAIPVASHINYVADSHNHNLVYAGASQTMSAVRSAHSHGFATSYGSSLSSNLAGINVNEPVEDAAAGTVEHQGRTTTGKASKKPRKRT